ncbi:MAG: Glu/Leu/Phe/Val dehydrogenase [Candidatus Hydrogenedentota bacterium]|nr:MAG: Glu/Leu/Phe/Val dehydrogenase [Candidatus Hydrogenedentota bacterium]
MIIFQRMAEYDYEELIFFQDRSTGLQAIVAIHNTALGPALGGCRFWHYTSERAAIDDVLRLARGMTYKASVAGLNLGGGKSVIIGNPKTHKTEALLRAFGRFIHTLRGRYIVAEDVGTSTEDMRIIHKETKYVVGLETTRGGSGDPSPVTAYGVLHGMKACARAVFGTGNLGGLTVAIQGAGNVGYHLAKYLAKEGARIMITDIYKNKARRVVDEFGAQYVNPDKIYSVKCDILSPCALGGILDDKSIRRLKCRIVAGSANNQLKSDRHGDKVERRGILYAPDYVINAGGLINVAEELRGYDRSRALRKAAGIYNAVARVIRIANKEEMPTHLAADKMAERRIERAQKVRTIHGARRKPLLRKTFT